jgi:eukaryotic-like serine/threonine-protein kinase
VRDAARDGAPRPGGARVVPASYQPRAPQHRRPVSPLADEINRRIRDRVQRAVATPPAPAPAPPPVPPEPPAMPSGRVRFAELATSMFWAAPLVAALTLPAVAALEVDPGQHPQRAAYLYLMALLGTWTALIPGKVLETRRLDWATRRLIAAGVGWLTGFAGLSLARMLKLDLALQPEFFDNPLGLMPFYFAALYAITAGWWSRTTRERPARFLLRTVLWTGVAAGALFPLWPYQRQDEIAIALMVATAVQVVSPWNEAAAAYARYVKATKKRLKAEG